MQLLKNIRTVLFWSSAVARAYLLILLATIFLIFLVSLALTVTERGNAAIQSIISSMLTSIIAKLTNI